MHNVDHVTGRAWSLQSVQLVNAVESECRSDEAGFKIIDIKRLSDCPIAELENWLIVDFYIRFIQALATIVCLHSLVRFR